ncbi:MAG: hypothetical protein GDA56_22275 [Hormoscilla sp. GM7CHS1pb]|nr:hypothetical protein [Hormoscilla sp. GM7CHS1pb]
MGVRSFQGNIDIDGDGTNDLTDGSKDYPWATDEYLAKFDSNGDFVKALKLGHHGSIDIDNDDILVPHIASSIAIDSDDNLWVTGSFHESMDLDGDGENDLTSNGEHDSYVAKFSSNVDLVQAYNIGGSDSDYGDVIAADSNGNVWAAGSFRDSIDINGDGSNDLTPMALRISM